MYYFLGMILLLLLLFILGKQDYWERDPGVQKNRILQEERKRRLKKPLGRMLEVDPHEKTEDLNDLTAIMGELKKVSHMKMDRGVEEFIKQECKNREELINLFQIFMQRALNQGRTYCTLEDRDVLWNNIHWPHPYPAPMPDIGSIHTLGLIHGETVRIKIYCAATPSHRGKGRITSLEIVSFCYPPLEKRLRDFNIFLKFYPNIPENHGEWEAALVLAIYSALIHKKLPVDYVLGGMNPQGSILLPDPKILEGLKGQERVLISPGFQREYLKNKSLDLIVADHIQEALKIMQSSPKLEYYRNQIDFLIE